MAQRLKGGVGWKAKERCLRPTGILAGATNLEFSQLDEKNRIFCRWRGLLPPARPPPGEQAGGEIRC
ncbi:MAG: hypothetical protein KME26_23195 [Oscillatoria princeps RMCB-10]|nr:hypothetical protein [Oscillatoria princeps RMCB-10]